MSSHLPNKKNIYKSSNNPSGLQASSKGVDSRFGGFSVLAETKPPKSLRIVDSNPATHQDTSASHQPLKQTMGSSASSESKPIDSKPTAHQDTSASHQPLQQTMGSSASSESKPEPSKVTSAPNVKKNVEPARGSGSAVALPAEVKEILQEEYEKFTKGKYKYPHGLDAIWEAGDKKKTTELKAASEKATNAPDLGSPFSNLDLEAVRKAFPNASLSTKAVSSGNGATEALPSSSIAAMMPASITTGAPAKSIFSIDSPSPATKPTLCKPFDFFTNPPPSTPSDQAFGSSITTKMSASTTAAAPAKSIFSIDLPSSAAAKPAPGKYFDSSKDPSPAAKATPPDRSFGFSTNPLFLNLPFTPGLYEQKVSFKGVLAGCENEMLVPSTASPLMPNWKPTVETTPGIWDREIQEYQAITFMAAFKPFSFEELRLADYLVGHKCPSASVFHPPIDPATLGQPARDHPYASLLWPRAKPPSFQTYDPGTLTQILVPPAHRWSRAPLFNLTTHLDFYTVSDPFKSVYAPGKEKAFANNIHGAALAVEKASASPSPFDPFLQPSVFKMFTPLTSRRKFSAEDKESPSEAPAVAKAKLAYHSDVLVIWVLSKHLWEEHYVALKAKLLRYPPQSVDYIVYVRRKLDAWEEGHLNELGTKLEKRNNELVNELARGKNDRPEGKMWEAGKFDACREYKKKESAAGVASRPGKGFWGESGKHGNGNTKTGEGGSEGLFVFEKPSDASGGRGFKLFSGGASASSEAKPAAAATDGQHEGQRFAAGSLWDEIGSASPGSTTGALLFGGPSKPATTGLDLGLTSKPTTGGVLFGEPPKPATTGSVFGWSSNPATTGLIFGRPSASNEAAFKARWGQKPPFVFGTSGGETGGGSSDPGKFNLLSGEASGADSEAETEADEAGVDKERGEVGGGENNVGIVFGSAGETASATSTTGATFGGSDAGSEAGPGP